MEELEPVISVQGSNTGPWRCRLTRASGIVCHWAELYPTRVAFYDGDDIVTYERFRRVILEARETLARAGVSGGDRVVVVGLNSVEMAACLFAAHELDAWPALLNARLSTREVEEAVEFLGARVALFVTRDSAEGDAHAASFGASPGVGVAIAVFDRAANAEPVGGTAEDVAALILTSGSTGKAKAVMLSHRALLAVADLSAGRPNSSGNDVFYGIAPFAHVIGLGTTLVSALSLGAAIELAPRFDPALLARSIASGRLTRMIGVPLVYAKLLEHIETSKVDVTGHRLQALTCGGAPLDPGLKARVERAFGLPMTNGYGCSECSPIARGEGSGLGAPFDEVQLRIVNGGEDAPAGEIGEIWTKGPFMMSGYYRDAEGTAATMREDGWLATGDLGRLDEEGQLEIVGRIKEVIIRSGFNVYPAEVEGVLNSHPQVGQSAVIGRQLPDLNEEVVAFVEPKPGSSILIEELALFAGERLAPYKKPARILLLPELPVGPTGKILKPVLVKLAEQSAER